MKRRFFIILVTGAGLLCLARGVRTMRNESPSEPRFAFKNLSVAAFQAPHASGKTFSVDVYQWSDALGQPRAMSLVRNDVPDPTGSFGGYMRSYQYLADHETRICTGASDDNPGFGFLVNHYNDSEGANQWVASLDFPGSYQRLFQGAHHALHEYRWPLEIQGETMLATVHWFMANGLDHPVFAVTYDLTQTRPNSIQADTRSPYGDIGWDGDRTSRVSGVAWGDRYQFKTTSKTLSKKSSWTYAAKNLIPYTHMWSDEANAEMGLVQTQTWWQHDAGGYWFHASWGRTSDGPMPEDWNWPYQLNQYQLASDPASKRIAWGSNYGAVGQVEYNAYGDDKKLSGYPYQSYAVYTVFGLHSEKAVEAQVTQMETVQSVAIQGGNVRPASTAPAGPGRTDQVVLQPQGWNHIYGVWELERVDGNRLSFDIKVGRGRLRNPIFRFPVDRRFKAVHVVRDGIQLTVDKDYLWSDDPKSGMIWMTLIGELQGSSQVDIVLAG